MGARAKTTIRTTRPVAGSRATGASTGKTPGLFVVVDDSAASTRAVSYLARLFTASRFRDVSFCLAYIMPALPAQLLEFGGTEDPRREVRLSGRLARRQTEWAASAERGPAQWLKKARAQLTRAGARPSTITTCLSSPRDLRAPAEEVCLLARDYRCETIVVGHHAHSWFGGGRRRLAEHLIRDAKGFAVWVVD